MYMLLIRKKIMGNIIMYFVLCLTSATFLADASVYRNSKKKVAHENRE